jgi:hypothetical protein
MSNAELLDRAAGQTTCQILGIAGGTLVGTGVASFAAGGFGLIPFTAGAATLLASNYLCPDMPLGDAAPPNNQIDGCSEIKEGGYGQYQYKLPGGGWGNGQGSWILSQAVRIVPYPPFQSSVGGTWSVNCEVYSATDGTTDTIGGFATESDAAAVTFRIDPTNGDCKSDSDNLPQPPTEAFDPIPYTDPVTNCNYTVQLQGFAEEQPGGVVQPVYLVEGVTEERAGGRMGGCNFPPTIYSPGFGGGGRQIPVPPGGPPPDGPGGVPWWAGPVIGGAVGAGLKLIGDEIARMSEPDVDEGSFLFTAPCDEDDNGNPLTQRYLFAKSSFNQRLLNHQIALMDMLQQHLNWKTPTCDGDDYEESEGDWRTVSFRSDQTSPYGKSRLRKRFRYRSTSGWTYDAIINHWKDFVWESGPVVVKHLGSSWGSPQVWAATADEGKRVIRHAAGEAGFDPDQVGRWSISGSRSPRLGVSDTMRVDTTGGYYWITSRDGSDNRPIVAAVPHPGSGVDITEID